MSPFHRLTLLTRVQDCEAGAHGPMGNFHKRVSHLCHRMGDDHCNMFLHGWSYSQRPLNRETPLISALG